MKVNFDNVQFLERAGDFLEEFPNFPRELLVDVARHPDTREMDPHAADVDYPIVRCRRGDITVIVGLMDPDCPTIIFVHLNFPEEDDRRGDNRTSGGGSKLPTSTKQLKGWLYAQGARVSINGRGHFNVYYGDHLIGSIGGTVSSRNVKNDFMFIRRRLFAVKAVESWEGLHPEDSPAKKE
jgi:hypothetical protein